MRALLLTLVVATLPGCCLLSWIPWDGGPLGPEHDEVWIPGEEEDMQVPYGMIPVEDHPMRDSFPERTLYASENPTPCQHSECAMPMLWTLNTNGKKEPFDLTAKPKDGKFVSHFAICPHAKRFRKPRAKRKT